MVQICSFAYSSFVPSLTSPTDGTRTRPSYRTRLTMGAQQPLSMKNKHTSAVKRLPRSVYAREGATAMDHQESDTPILRGVPIAGRRPPKLGRRLLYWPPST